MTLELTLHGCKVFIKSDDSTYINVILNDGKTENEVVFRYVHVDMFELIDVIKSYIYGECSEFTEGQRVMHKGLGIGTVICMNMDGYYGVEFDNYAGRLHNCRHGSIAWGRRGTKENCYWVEPSEIAIIEKHKLQNYEAFFECFQRYVEEKQKGEW